MGRSKLEAEMCELAATGIASALIHLKIMRALQTKGVFSDVEIAAIYEASREAALRSGGSNQTLSKLVAQEIDDLWKQTLPAGTKH